MDDVHSAANGTTRTSVEAGVSVPRGGCQCEACYPFDYSDPMSIRMIVCAICGNKRCPHATDHRNACTNSNEPGQKGSSWEHVKPWADPPASSAAPEPAKAPPEVLPNLGAAR